MMVIRVDSYVFENGPAQNAGLSAKDEIIAIDGWRVTGNLKAELARLRADVPVEVVYSRDRELSSCDVVPVSDSRFDYEIVSTNKPVKSQIKRKSLWLSRSV